MAKFKYVGDPRDGFSGPETTEQFGYKWVKGEVIEVRDGTDEEKSLVEKISRHSHFVSMDDGEKAGEVDAQRKAMEKGKQDRARTAAEAEKASVEEAEKQRQADIRAAEVANKGANPSPAPRWQR